MAAVVVVVLAVVVMVVVVIIIIIIVVVVVHSCERGHAFMRARVRRRESMCAVWTCVTQLSCHQL